WCRCSCQRRHGLGPSITGGPATRWSWVPTRSPRWPRCRATKGRAVCCMTDPSSRLDTYARGATSTHLKTWRRYVMKLEQSFEVSAPLDVVWEALVDVERVAPCLPGAAVTGRNDDGSYD